MIHSLWVRRAAAMAGPAALIFFCSSSARLDTFVANGGYARAREAAADCGRVYVSAFNDSEPAPQSLLPHFSDAGEGLAYTYRPAVFSEIGAPGEAVRMDGGEMKGAVYMPVDSMTLSLLDLPAGARVDRVQTADWSATVTSMQTPVGCVRMEVTANPATVQVGIPRGSENGPSSGNYNQVVTSASIASIVGANRVNTRDRVPAINPDTIKGSFIIRAYENGVRVPHLKVDVHMDPRGNPGIYGHTYPHNHLLRGLPRLLASVRIASADGHIFARGQATVVTTDDQGQAVVPIRPGYRGGPEALVAAAIFPGVRDSVRGSGAVVVRHRGGFVHIAQAITQVNTVRAPAASPSFPFILTGYTARHANGLFVRADLARPLASMLMEIWSQDPGRRASRTPRYIVFNDMSLEYGGLFKLNDSNDCDDPVGPHATHLSGNDFDVSPCYSQGSNGLTTVGAADCEHGSGHLKINEAVLASMVLGAYGGAILEHHPSTDGAPYHYHIRFPDH